jgi:hypothetical protein
MDSFSCRLWSSVGTAEMGTEPGSVSVVLACDASARPHRMVYTMLKKGGIPSVVAKNVIVSAE